MRGRLRDLRTPPFTPQTNGKAERFIQTLLRKRAYHQPHASLTRREEAPGPCVYLYTWHRRHVNLQGCLPISRLVSEDNLVRLRS